MKPIIAVFSGYITIFLHVLFILVLLLSRLPYQRKINMLVLGRGGSKTDGIFLGP